MPGTYLVENNVSSHQSAQWVDQEKQVIKGIITFN